MNDIAVLVGEDLNFDVPWRRNVFFDQHAAGAESRLSLADRRCKRGIEFVAPLDAAHPATAAAGRRFDQHRIADLVGLLLEEFAVLPFAVIAGHDRHARLLHQRLGAILKAHGADRRGRRPDKDQTGARARFGEVGVLGEKSVSRMDAFGARRALRPRSGVRSTDSSHARPQARANRPRRIVACAARVRQRPNRPRWCACPCVWRCARPGRRFRRDWR